MPIFGSRRPGELIGLRRRAKKGVGKNDRKRRREEIGTDTTTLELQMNAGNSYDEEHKHQKLSNAYFRNEAPR